MSDRVQAVQDADDPHLVLRIGDVQVGEDRKDKKLGADVGEVGGFDLRLSGQFGQPAVVVLTGGPAGAGLDHHEVVVVHQVAVLNVAATSRSRRPAIKGRRRGWRLWRRLTVRCPMTSRLVATGAVAASPRQRRPLRCPCCHGRRPNGLSIVRCCRPSGRRRWRAGLLPCPLGARRMRRTGRRSQSGRFRPGSRCRSR